MDTQETFKIPKRSCEVCPVPPKRRKRGVHISNGEVKVPCKGSPPTHKIYRINRHPHVLILDTLDSKGSATHMENFMSCLSSNTEREDCLKHIVTQIEFCVETNTYLSGMFKIQDGKIIANGDCLSELISIFIKNRCRETDGSAHARSSVINSQFKDCQ